MGGNTRNILSNSASQWGSLTVFLGFAIVLALVGIGCRENKLFVSTQDSSGAEASLAKAREMILSGEQTGTIDDKDIILDSSLLSLMSINDTASNKILSEIADAFRRTNQVERYVDEGITIYEAQVETDNSNVYTLRIRVTETMNAINIDFLN